MSHGFPEREELVEDTLPFLAIEENGGPFADKPYVAGYQLGRYHAMLELAHHQEMMPPVFVCFEENVETVIQMALLNGFDAERVDEGQGSVDLEFSRICYCDDCLRADDAGV